MGLVSVSARPRIGRFDIIRKTFPEGATLAEMAGELGEAMPPEFWAVGIALIDDGDPVEAHFWAEVRPRAGQAVAFHTALGKGGTTLQLVATIAIVAAQAAAIVALGPAGLALAPIWGVAAGVWAAAGIGLAGAVLIPFLAAQPKVKPPKAPKQLGDAGSSGNQLAPYDQLATVLGVRRVPMPYLAPPFVNLQNENSYGFGILGLAGRHEIREPWSNGAPIETVLSNVEEGDLSDPAPSIYTETVWQETGTEFARHSMQFDSSGDTQWTLDHSNNTADVTLYDLPKFQWFRLGAQALPPECAFDLRFDQGMQNVSTGNKGGCAFQIVLKNNADDSLIYLPELHCQVASRSPFRLKIVLLFSADPGGLTSPSASDPWAAAYANSVTQSNWGFVADPYYGAGAIASHVGVGQYLGHGLGYTSFEGAVHVYVDPASVAVKPGFSVGIRCGSGYSVARFHNASNTYDYNGGAAINPGWFTYYNTGSALRTIEDQSKITSHCVLEYVTRKYDVDPLNTEGIAFYEFQTQNRAVAQVSALCGRYVEKLWNGSAWLDSPHVSSNPAELAYDVMRNSLDTLNARPLSDTIIDAAELGAWASYCKANFLECNAFINSGSVEDALATCYIAGGAYLKRSDKWGVYIEQDRTAEIPVQNFSPRNSQTFVVEKVFSNKPHALNVTFDDENDDYQTQPNFVVYAPGYDVTNATLFESIDFRGVTSEDQARFLADRALKIAKYRDKVYSLTTDARYLVSGRGSLVGVSHYVLDEAHGFAAIRDVKRQVIGGVNKITGFTLDNELDMQPTTTGIAITTNSATIVAAQSSQVGKIRRLLFTTPLADDPSIEEGCTITCGIVNEEYIRCIVDDVQPGADGTAKLILVDEAPEIFA